MSYTRKILTYSALEYTGDTSAITAFGATWSSLGDDQVQILVGNKLLAVGSYLLKDDIGNFTVESPQDFSDYYQLSV